LPFATLALAILLGGYLRFVNLDTLELSADEGASWAAAAAPSIVEVMRAQARLNPGELGLHDVALHLWIAVSGDSLLAMRSLSAAAGTLAVVLVYFVTREVLALPPFSDDPHPAPAQSFDAADNALPAEIAALLFAVNLVTIKYSREARMYPFALALTFAQTLAFLRALRRGGTTDYAATVALTALAIGATFTATLMLIPEGLYLILVLLRSRYPGPARVARCGVALAGGIVLIAPLLTLYLRARGGAPDAATWDWISRPSLGAPITLFNKATGTYGFPLLAILILTGVARRWARRREAITYLLLWTFAPPILLTIVSFVLRPAFVERYLLSSFAPFFILAGIGLLELRPPALRPGALALVVAVALAHNADWHARAHGDEWAEATAAAAAGLTAPGAIGVAPRYATNVVRYYLRDRPSPPVVESLDSAPPPAVVIVAEAFAATHATDLARRYPHLLAHPHGLLVLH
jgi:hypothetical protein